MNLQADTVRARRQERSVDDSFLADSAHPDSNGRSRGDTSAVRILRIRARELLEPAGMWTWVLAGMGFLVGWGIYAFRPGTSGFADTHQFQVWIALTGAQTALWAGVLPTMWKLLGELRHRYPQHARRRAPLLAFLMLAIFVMALIMFARGLHGGTPVTHHALRSNVLSLLGLVALFPAIVGTWQLQSVLDDIRRRLSSQEEHSWSRLHAEISCNLMYLRAVLQRFLVVLGSAIGVLTLAAGAQRNAMLAWDRASETYAIQYVILPGLVLTIILAAIHLPVYASLERGCRELVDSYCPLSGDIPPDLDWYTKRDRLKALLGLGFRAERVASIAILAPLGGSLVSILLPQV